MTIPWRAAALLLLGSIPAGAAEPAWAPAASATIHPGVQTISPSGQCTSNFVFTDRAGNVYLGQAAHCTGTGGSTETDGCTARSLPLGTEIEVQGAVRPGVMVYNSWLTMQEMGETDENACAFNDLALVRIDPADAASVNPSIPVWGGPAGVGPAVPAGKLVYSYGNSELRLGLTELSPKLGTSLGPEGDGWSTSLYAILPGVPGDSGSAVLDSSGRAAGVVSTIVLAPTPASNNAGSIARELDYLRAHTALGGVALANGTEAFDGRPTRLLGGLAARR